MHHEITQPSGLRGEFRELTVADEDLLAAASRTGKIAKQERALDEMLRNCWVKTTDAGPYRKPTDEDESGSPRQFDLNDFVLGDKLWYALQLRIESMGSEVAIPVECPGGHTFQHEYDLRDIKMLKLPDAAAKSLREGVPLSFKLPRCGRTVKYILMTGRMQVQFSKAVRDFPGEISTELLASRIVEVSGFDEAGLDTETQTNIRGWIRRLGMFDAKAFREEMVKNDCGPDTNIKVKCDQCAREFTHDLMDGSGGFFDLAQE
ncbi:MAG TPA: hypothetical protein VM223_13650 [Planctomycetota bacterium]|nr:hypothetical protein [Planctomycetota bacterium]